MIIATAGHVDHGKTTLVKALTGVETDRLAEEKRRGMTIDLGFAYRDLADGGTLGFVDVPGHHKFVHTMVAGAAAIDFALLVVAADDGPMPQTREHLAILDLLNVPAGACVITKCDAVDPERVATVTAETEHLIEGTVLSGAEIFAVSATRVEGLDRLLEHLATKARVSSSRQANTPFRFFIDRAFAQKGSGTVVTGTVVSGRLSLQDQLCVSPSGARVRVRAIHTQSRSVDEGTSGQRLGINIAGEGSDLSKLSRGHQLVAVDRCRPAVRLDAEITLLATEAKAMGSRPTPIHFHLGAAEVLGSLQLLGSKTLAPGGVSLAHLKLETPLSMVCGDRFILRDAAAERTIGGGRVIDPFAPSRRIHAADRIAGVRAMNAATADKALSKLLALPAENAASVVLIERFCVAWNLYESDVEGLIQDSGSATFGAGDLRVVMSQDQALQVEQKTLAVVSHFHSDYPEQAGIKLGVLRKQVAPHLSAFVFDAILQDLSAREIVVLRSGAVARPNFVPSLPKDVQKLWMQIKPMLSAAGDVAPRVVELAEHLSHDPKTIESVLSKVAGAGLAHRVARNRFYLGADLLRLAEIAEHLVRCDQQNAFDAKAYRDASGLGRNLTIDVLEYFDACGLTVRRGSARTLVKDAAAIFGEQLDTARSAT